MKRMLAFAAVLAAACGLAGSAHADGDPASDYLLGQRVFFPYDAKLPADEQARFAGLVAAANRAGFKIRVALIASDYDLGAVTSLWRKPRPYARFLGQEIAFAYKQRLLVVMPNGFGFSWLGHPTAREYAVLAKVSPPGGKALLLQRAEVAVERLAAASGIKVRPPVHVTTPGRGNSVDRRRLVGGIAALLAVAFLARFLLGRRRHE
jgi:hypothetical protein